MTERTPEYQAKVRAFLKNDLGFNSDGIEFPTDRAAYDFAQGVRKTVIKAKGDTSQTSASNAEKPRNRQLNLVYGRSGGGGYHVADRNTGSILCTIPAGGGFSGSVRALEIMRALAGEKPIEEHVREQVEGRK